MIGYSAIALAISFIAIPLVFLFLENVIPLVTGAVTIIIIGGIIILVFKIFQSGNGESFSGNSSNQVYSQRVLNDNVESSGTNAKQVIHWDINEDAIVMVEETLLGSKIIKVYGKYLMSNEYDKEIVVPLHVSPIGHPDLSDLKNGSLIITVKGKKITERDLHYK